jgi:GTP-binding protein HflX
VKNRISYLKREIQEIDQRKQREVRSRKDRFTTSLVGYTNSGKSTLMNKLTGADQHTADQLFATLDTKTVRWHLGEGRVALLSDTVGFVRNLPHHLVASFRATLEEAIHADLLLHVVDSSSPSSWQQMESVDEVLTSLGCDEIPQISVLNKVDIADDASTVEMLARHRSKAFLTSAVSGEGLDELINEVIERMKGETVEVTIYVPHDTGKLHADIDRLADVHGRRYRAGGVELDVRMNRTQFAQLRGRHPDLSIVKGLGSPADGTEPDELA